MNKKTRYSGVVYSTNPDFKYAVNDNPEPDTLQPSGQDLRIQLDKKQRGGKKVTLVTGFIGKSEDLESLGKVLKSKCGTGGSVKDSVIIIQGDFRTKVFELLKLMGYKVKLSGG